jgi:plasmid rolling circle replication initiator protein Rep
MDQNLDNTYFITYSNYFELEGKTFAFRKKQLFDITNIPKLLETKDNNNCQGYWINRKWFSLSKLKPIVKTETKIINVSDLQWNLQINLDHVFNIKSPIS